MGDLADVIGGGRLQSMLALDAPYAVHDVLTRLADAADHLHHDHNCDADGWEMTRAAAASARRIVAALVGYKPPDRDAEVDARIADAVAAERHAAAAWVREWDPKLGQIASHIEDGRHISTDAPPLPSLRMVMLARDEAWRQVETLTAERDGLHAELDKRVPPHCQHAMDPGHSVHPDRVGPSVMDAEIERLTAERDRRIDPVEHARAVMEAWLACFVGQASAEYEEHGTGETILWRQAAMGWAQSAERATLLARVGADVLAEVEDG